MTSFSTCTIRAHFYVTLPVFSNGDNSAWLTSKFDGWVGSIDVTVDRAFSDGAAGIGYPTAPLTYAWTIAGDEFRFERGRATSPAPVLRFRGDRPALIELTVTDADGATATAHAHLQLTVR